MIYCSLGTRPSNGRAMEGATTAMLTAGKQTKLLTIDVASTKAKAEEEGNSDAE